jgi:hypothetical protein
VPDTTTWIFDITLAPRYQMNVTVKDRLTCYFTAVHADIETLNRLI